MTALTWVVRLIIFVALTLFAILNTEPVSLRFFAGYVWQAPLVLVLLAFFIGGVILGALSLLGVIFRQRREISRLKRAVGRKPEVPDVVVPPVV